MKKQEWLNEYYRTLEEEEEARNVSLPQKIGGWIIALISVAGLILWAADVFGGGRL